jgi:hypothetical protein
MPNCAPLLARLAVAAVLTLGCHANRPTVLLMDSRHPSRVYDSSTVAVNGTNADVVSEILAGLPIRTQKEVIDPSWRREEELRRLAPDLIVIHYSGFCEARCTDRSRLRDLVAAFSTSNTRFLVYSRTREDSLRIGVDSLLQDVERAHPGTLRRIGVFGLTDHGPSRWRDSLTAGALRRRVEEVLGLRRPNL